MAAGIQIGSTFAGYSIEGVLGRGGMGVVYVASQPELERKVAIKVIAPALASDPDYLDRFRRESRLAAAIEHPNAIPIYEAGVADEDTPYLVMRYVDGVDLSSLIRSQGTLDGARASRIVDQVSGALDEAHARGLVHRDVKPGNVIVEDRRGTEHAYLTDFGLTKQMDATSGVTATGRWVGTIDYASPEQIRGKRVDARSDVYSLGCVLFVALTGRLPFEREADVAKLYAHINDPAPAPSGLAQGVSPELDAVVARALAKDPDERFPSAGDLGRAALAALTGSAIGEPERTVATGEAAPVPAGPTDASTVPSEGLAQTAPATAPDTAPIETASEGVPPPAVPRPERPGAGRGRWVAAVAGIAIAGLAVLGFSVLAGGGSSGGGGTGGNGGGETGAAAIQFAPFTGSGEFTVDVPADWGNTYTDKPLPGQDRGQFRTEFTSPNGKLTLQILQEPDTPAVERANTAQSEREGDPNYKLVQEPTQATLGTRDAVLFAYTHDEEGMGLATIYNYAFNDGGFGWRTRVAGAAGGDRKAQARQVATEAATTLQVKGSS